MHKASVKLFYEPKLIICSIMCKYLWSEIAVFGEIGIHIGILYKSLPVSGVSGL